MPRLVLLEDDGRELFSGAISRENVDRIRGFMLRHQPTIRSLAAASRVYDELVEMGLLKPARPQRRKVRR